MKSKTSSVVQICLVFLVLLLTAVVVVLVRANGELSLAFARPQYGRLSPDLRVQLINDLNGGDPTRIRAWADYFRHSLDLETNLTQGHSGLNDLFMVYKLHEQPGRSNYFGDLLNNLAGEQHLKESALVGYLGQPDKTLDRGGVKTLVYNFSSFGGRSAMGVVSITNGNVAGITIQLKEGSQ